MGCEYGGVTMSEPEHVVYARYFQDVLGCQIIPLWGVDTTPSGAVICRCREGAMCENTGKHPATPWKGKPSRLPNLTQNWGYSTDRLVVIDLDRHDVTIPWSLPETYEIGTRKGKHMIYRWDGEPLATRVGYFPGVDIKAHGGLVVGAGSRRSDGGTYEPLNSSLIAPLPDFVAKAVGRPREYALISGKLMERTSPIMREYVEAMCSQVRNANERNVTLFRTLTSVMRGQFVGQDAVNEILVAAYEAGLGLEEITRTYESAMKSVYGEVPT